MAPLLRERRLEAQGRKPKRLVLLFTPLTHPPEWWPERGGSELVLTEPLADFRGLEDHMLFVRQVDHTWTEGNHHEAGMVQLFTGARYTDTIARYANGPSLDQVLLQRHNLRDGTPIASIHLTAGDQAGSVQRHLLCYSGPGQPIEHEPDPVSAYEKIFQGVAFGSQPEEPAAAPEDLRLAAKARASEAILDVDTEQLRFMQRFLGQSEREKLELHVDALNELRARAAMSAASNADDLSAPLIGGVCEDLPVEEVGRSLGNEATIKEWAELQADIIVNAFSCDRTRVAAFELSSSGADHYRLFGLEESWHNGIAHVSRTDDSVDLAGQTMSSREAFILFDRYWAGHVAYLARRLAETPEGDGSMLDNTLLYWGVATGTNHSHLPNDVQYLLVGGRNLGLQTGQFLDVGRAIAPQLHTSVMNAFGYEATGIGDEPDAGALPGIIG